MFSIIEVYQLQIEIKTWNVEGEGLYDYKTKTFRRVIDENDEDNYYIRRYNNCIIKKVNQSDINFENEVILFRTRKSLKNDNQYEIINPTKKSMKRNQENINNLDNNAWLVIGTNSNHRQKENENEQYILNENDIIKLVLKKYEIIKKNIKISNDNDKGKCAGDDCYNISQMNKQKGSIFDISIEKGQYKITKNKNKVGCEQINNIKENEVNKSTCVICKEDKSTLENPILHLCKCKNWIHYQYLKQYMKKKIEIHENSKCTVKTYICHTFNCDECLTPYPLRFKIKEYNKIYKLIDYNIAPEINHIVLESLDYIKDGTNLKIIHSVKLIDEIISIGRFNTNDIFDANPSISRNHAVLKFDKKNGILTIEDRKSKFGTLVLIKDNIKMKEKKICFQVGKSLVTAELVKKKETELYSDEYSSNDINSN